MKGGGYQTSFTFLKIKNKERGKKMKEKEETKNALNPSNSENRKIYEEDESKNQNQNAESQRIKELEAELKKLLIREEERKADYEKRLKNYELYAGEQAIMKEADETKKHYEKFDFDKELENEKFVRLLNCGLDVKTAYEATHLEEIKAAAKNSAKSDELKKRPLENGTVKGGGALLKSGVYALTKKEREELARRTQKGETIRF